MQTGDLFTAIQKEIIGEELLQKAQTVDSHANGVQIWGTETVQKIALGVSCNYEFLDKATRWGAEVCIFHHGLSLSKYAIRNECLSPSLQKQLRQVFEHELTIAGYHYVLDIHPKIGHAAQIIEKLGATIQEPFFKLNGADWGYIANYHEPKTAQEVAQECAKLFKHDVFMVLGGAQQIKRISVVTGAGKPQVEHIFDLHNKAVDLHITGEVSEHLPAIAKETGFHYFACGHYATETLGMQALTNELQALFPKLEFQFIDVWNEL